MAPQVRLELTTLRLTAECSAIELLRIIRGLWRDSFACPAVCLSASGALRLALAHAPASHCASASRSPRPASARHPVLPYVLGAGKTFVPPAPLGSRQLPTLPSRSQLSTISVWRLNFCVRYGYRWCPPAIVTGNFPQGSFSLAPHSPHLQNCTAIELTRKHSLFQIFRLFPSRSPRPPLSRFLRFLRLLLDGFPFSDQALDRLVSPSSTPHSASTDDLSTSSSLRGLTCFKQWQSSSSGGLHA